MNKTSTGTSLLQPNQGISHFLLTDSKRIKKDPGDFFFVGMCYLPRFWFHIDSSLEGQTSNQVT